MYCVHGTRNYVSWPMVTSTGSRYSTAAALPVLATMLTRTVRTMALPGLPPPRLPPDVESGCRHTSRIVHSSSRNISVIIPSTEVLFLLGPYLQSILRFLAPVSFLSVPFYPLPLPLPLLRWNQKWSLPHACPTQENHTQTEMIEF